MASPLPPAPVPRLRGSEVGWLRDFAVPMLDGSEVGWLRGLDRGGRPELRFRGPRGSVVLEGGCSSNVLRICRPGEGFPFNVSRIRAPGAV